MNLKSKIGCRKSVLNSISHTDHKKQLTQGVSPFNSSHLTHRPQTNTLKKPTERIAKENGRSGEDKVALQSTCHVALDACIKDGECMTSLTPVLQKCHSMECDREGCMAALRGFYRKPGVHWNTEIAFCLCK